MAARIITESDVRDGRAGDPIVVDERTTITPSALDAADRLGVRVVWSRDGRGPAPSAPQPTRGGAAPGRTAVPVVHLPDGRYVVEVERGRVRLFRWTDRGPVPLET